MGILEAQLRRAGYSTLQAYRSSAAWRALVDRYSLHPKLPMCCISCDALQCRLYHRTYQRLGCEWLTDMVPLCDRCSEWVAEYLKAHPEYNMTVIHTILQYRNGWSKSEMTRRFEPYKLKGRVNGFNINPKD